MIEFKITTPAKKAAYQILADCLWETTEKHKYKVRPVDIDTFIDDPQYLGSIYGGDAVFPFWRKLLREVYPNEFITQYEEVVLSAAIGAGKSTLTTISIAYEIYKILCLKDPNKHFGLLPTDVIVFALFAATAGTAQDVNWGYLSNVLFQSPFFATHLDFKETKASSILLTPHLGVQVGSRSRKALGKAVLSAVLDEGNFGIIENQVKDNYLAIMRRRSSRFRKGFSVPGVVWLASSPRTGDDFINERIKKAESNKRVLIVDNLPIWIIRKEKNNYCGKTFFVFCGDESQDAAILGEKDSPKNYPADLIMEVPEEHRIEFEEDLLEAIRDIGGRRVSSTMNLFRSYSSLTRAFTKMNLFKTDIIPVHLGMTLYDFQQYINFPVLQTLVQDKTPRNIHLDYAFSGDCFGIASCLSFERALLDPMTNSVTTRKLFTSDFAIALQATSSDGMPTSAIVSFIKWLRNQGYNINLVTGDKPAMNTVIPELKLAKFKTEYLSVDTDRAPYILLRQKVLSGEYSGINNKRLINELYNLRDLGNKIDHPDKNPDGSIGSKDIADGVAGSMYSCFTHGKISAQENLNQAMEQLNKSTTAEQKEKRNARRLQNALYYSRFR